MNHPQAYEGTYEGEQAIWLKAGPYEAAALPQIGGNLIAFRDVTKNYAFLHEPTSEEMPAFKQRPIIHGIPVLFPPNRYEDGKFPWNGSVYEFPINEPERSNHLHGFLHNIPWTVESMGADKTESWVTLVQTVDRNHDMFAFFPHSFTFKLRYSLSSMGLLQHVTIRNDGVEPMPCLLAFHTAINAPFAPDSEAKHYKVRLTLGERWEMDERMLPTGHYQALSESELRLQNEGIYPFFTELDNHYTAQPVNGRNRMELTDAQERITLVYDVGTAYKQWMIWNNFAAEGFFCPEPQINVVNAPNVTGMSAEQLGFISLLPGEIWESSSRIYVRTHQEIS